MTTAKLGRVQLRIMQILWQRGRAKARDITDALNESEPIAHSTVQTLLRTLADKRTVAHEVEGRTFIFYPTVEEDQFKQNATRDLVERVFGGNVGNLVAHLLKDENVSRKGINQIRRLIDDRPARKGEK